MSVGIVSVLRITSGRRDDLLAVMRDSASHSQGLGATVSVRSLLSGGTNSGNLVYITQFATSAARAEYLDALQKPGNTSPLVQATRGATPPGTLVNRYMLNEIPEGEPLPGSLAAVLTTARFAVPAGHTRAAQTALLEAKAVRTALGISSAVYATVYGGDLTGMLQLSTRHDSFAELDRATQQVADHNRPQSGSAAGGPYGPVPQAVAAGHLVQVSSTVSTLIVP